MSDQIETITLLDEQTDGGRQWWELSDQVNCQLEFQTLQVGLSQGVQVLNAHVGQVRLSLILSRGANLGSLSFDGVSVGWQSPIQGPVHPNFVPLYRPDGLGWLAGFDEVLARCGLGNVGGPEFNEKHQLVQPLHGAISGQPCRTAIATVDRQARQVTIETVTEECLFHFNRVQVRSRTIIPMTGTWVEVQDEVTNLGARPADVMLLHHWNFGPPFVEADSRIYVDHQEMAPRNAHAAASVSRWDRMPGPQAGTEETVYFFRPASDAAGRSTAIVTDAEGEKGVGVQWETQGLPCFTLWKNPVATQDGYAIGLEPGTCYPNGRTHEQQVGRTVCLEAGQMHPVKVRVQGWLNDSDGLEQQVQAIQNRSASSTKHLSPVGQFGPVG